MNEKKTTIINESFISESNMVRTNKVLLIYTGGTIGMGKNSKTGALEPLDFTHLLASLPELEQVKTRVDVHQFSSPIDSSDMSPREWAQIVRIISKNYDFYDGFVILHGTDTMAYTASALSFMLENLTKPVILTGSQLPIGQLRTDGKENLITSIELAAYRNADGYPMTPEVAVYFNGHLLRGNRCTKCSSEEFNAFNTFNHAHLCDAGVEFTFRTHHILCPDYTRPMIPHLSMDSNVVVFSLFPGIQESLVRHILKSRELRGIVLRTFGSGNAPQAPWLLRLMREAAERGVVIVNVTQCLSGSVQMQRYDTGVYLQEAGVISGYDSTVEAAVTKLMFLLAHYNDTQVVRHQMAKSIAGEITVE